MRINNPNEIEDQLDLAALGYFVSVAEARGFSKASAVLNIPQPTLSRHIRRLEEQLGSRLFDRTGRGVLLTEVGESLYQHGKDILTRVQRARAEVSNLGNDPNGLAVLGLAPIAGRVLSVPVAQRFLQQAPHARLRIIEGFTGHVLEWIANGRIDVGILYDDTVNASFDTEPLWEEQYVVVSARGSGLERHKSISFADVTRRPLILPGRPHAMRLKIDEISAKLGLSLNVVLQIDGLNAILDLVHQDVGATILTPPALYGYQAIDEMVVTPLSDPLITVTVVAVCSRQHPITNTVRTLLRIVQEEGRNIRKSGRTDFSSVMKSCKTAQRVALALR